MIHANVVRGVVLSLALAACARAGSDAPPGDAERSGAARVVVPADARSPADARPAPPPVEHIVAGYEHTCVLLRGGAVRCWGMGDSGRLGTGDTENIGDDETPASIPNVALGGRAVQLTAGREHTCALLDTGKVRCWGGNAEGQLGYGNTRIIGDDETVGAAGDLSLGEPVLQIAAGAFHTCALLASRRVRCWGDSPQGQTGHGLDHRNIGDDELPSTFPVLDLGGKVLQIASAHGPPCALLEGGAVRCWGPVFGSTADGYTPAEEHPLVDLGAPAKVLSTGAGAGHTCAITTAGRVRCWGLDNDVALGFTHDLIGVGVTRGELPTPAELGDVPVPGRVTQVAAGSEHTCVLLDTGRVRCWGSGRLGLLGPGQPSHVLAKNAAEIDIGGRVVEIASGAFHMCALLDTGGVRCWGNNDVGPLGYGTAENVGEERSPAEAGDVPL